MTKDVKQEASEKKPLNVYQAIAAVQAGLAVDGIGKDRKNEQQNYKFRGIDDVFNALAPLLSKNGLCILPFVESRECVERVNAKGTALFYITVRVRFSFVSAADGSQHDVTTYGEAMDSGDKATNKAMSAAYKYACLQTFCIPTEGDNDADATTHEVAAKVKPIFESREALDLFVNNSVTAIMNAVSTDRIKDLRDLDAARRNAMKESHAQEDRDGYAKIIAAQNEMVKKLTPKTVEAAKQAVTLPADVASDPIPF